MFTYVFTAKYIIGLRKQTKKDSFAMLLTFIGGSLRNLKRITGCSTTV